MARRTTTAARVGDRAGDAASFSSKRERPEPEVPTLGLRGWLRWVWRQLTSMRVALMLLLLLAVAALPGSFFPQVPQDAAAVAEYRAENPALAPWLERLGMFDVYASPWFGAVYVLLFVSLIGCILPRVRVHLRALRTPPPRVPRSFARFPVADERVTTDTPEAVQDRVMRALRGRYRAKVTADGITAERGYLRETGNIVFHLSLVGILLSLAAGELYSYRGQAVVVEGEAFANSVVDYDSFTSGTFFDENDLQPFTFTLESFTSEFTADAQARDFAAHVAVTEPDGGERQETIKVNHPMNAGGANVYLSGNGFAPRVTVRDGAGDVAFADAVPFLPEDGVYTSRGVIKVPDVSPGQEQLGFTGAFLPTADVAADGTGLRSLHPQPHAPVLVLTLWAGDLGLDTGAPQNAYELETDQMRRVMEPADDGAGAGSDAGAAGGSDGAAGGSDAAAQQPLTILLAPGESVELPEGLGEITFESLPRFAALDLRYDPSLPWLLGSALAAMAGLGASLFVPRRRVWVRTSVQGARTVVAGAALARGEDAGLAGDLRRVLDAAVPEADGSPPAAPTTSRTPAGSQQPARAAAAQRPDPEDT